MAKARESQSNPRPAEIAGVAVRAPSISGELAAAVPESEARLSAQPEAASALRPAARQRPAVPGETATMSGRPIADLMDDNDSVSIRKGRRIVLKVSRAKAILSQLDDRHPQYRLLRAAIVRRDEILLDGLLEQLS